MGLARRQRRAAHDRTRAGRGRAPLTLGRPVPPGLLGVWSLESYEDRDDAASPWERPYGEARGVIVYDPTGALVVLVIGEPDPAGASSIIAYFGRFELAEWQEREGAIAGVVLHHMEEVSDPLLLADEPEREFVLDGDTLTIGDGVTYRRILRRA